ncbi:MAG: molecular chaperone DnaK [Myxococcota bacterium]|nr:molecular chaperone DnaK [Myxococcota bacterium]MDW8362499.1 molecular chaperone DnaK [Myxococcales bacterium]
MGKVIGIDLGTTNSCVAFVDRSGPVVIPNAEGSRTTPSVVAYAPDGSRKVGAVARRQAITNAENTVFAIKRLIGRKADSPEARRHASLVPYRVVPALNGDAWVHVAGREVSPQEVSAAILEKMRETAEAYLGEPVTEAVVTVPAYFDDAQRQATRDAGRIAGLEVRRIINEPTAAAIAYGFDKKEGQRTVAVYDLGGGTFDISILQIAGGVFQVRSTAGDTYLGGEDFDNAIVEHLVTGFQKETGIDLRTDRAALQRIKEQAERAKHELSSSLETEINLPFIAADASGPKHLMRTLRRSELETLVSDLVDRTLEPCRRGRARAGPRAVDEVILVGGMTRMPLVQRRVSEFFGKSPHKGVNPDEVVAIGAAIQAAALAGQLGEVLLLDVTPLSLGVETGGGVFHVLVPRNTTIPTRASEVFTTSVDNQPFVPIHVLQGERQMAADNKTLARFELAPIPPAPRGVPQIEVTFEIDADGIVNVSAKDLGTGRAQSVRIVASSGLTKEQVDRLVQEAERYKAADEKRKELAELRNAATGLIYTSEKACDEVGDAVPADLVAAVRADIAALRALLDGAEDAIAIREAVQRLEQSAYRMAEKLYGSAG